MAVDDVLEHGAPWKLLAVDCGDIWRLIAIEVLGREPRRGFPPAAERARLETAFTRVTRPHRRAPLTTVALTESFAPGMLIAAGIAVLGLQYPTAPMTFIQSRGAFTGRCSGRRRARAPDRHGAGTPVPRPSAAGAFTSSTATSRRATS